MEIELANEDALLGKTSDLENVSGESVFLNSENIFEEDNFKLLKDILGIKLPFFIERRNGSNGDLQNFSYAISLPTPEGYYYHINEDTESDFCVLGDFVSKDPVNLKNGRKGILIVKNGFGEWKLWCQQYDQKLMLREFNMIDNEMNKIMKDGVSYNYSVDTLSRDISASVNSSLEI